MSYEFPVFESSDWLGYLIRLRHPSLRLVIPRSEATRNLLFPATSTPADPLDRPSIRAVRQKHESPGSHPGHFILKGCWTPPASLNDKRGSAGVKSLKEKSSDRGG
jgi:hypothetical protein